MRRLGLFLLLLVLCCNPGSAQEFPEDPAHVTSLSQVESLSGHSLGAAGANARALPPLALELIKDFETWVPIAYNDASLYCTIGYGHLIALKPCVEASSELSKFEQPLSEPAGLELLDSDSIIARLSVQQRVSQPLSDEQFGALTSFVFNVGSKNFEKSRLLRFLNNREYVGAAKEFPRWIKSKGKVLRGLITRRNCEAALFNGQLVQTPDKEFNRNECGGLGAVPSVENLIDIDVGEQ